MARTNHSSGRPATAVVYLARGQGRDFQAHLERFKVSYEANDPGAEHRLYVIFKGFNDRTARAQAAETFADLDATVIETDDLRFDIGAYADALPSITEDLVCFLNTYSEIASPHWLRKLIDNLLSPGVGIVGATGSYESLHTLNRTFPGFPNPHLRTTAIALRRLHADQLLRSFQIGNKLDTFFIESGDGGLTQRILALGLTCLLVGADGRGFAPDQWPRSGTYRLGQQENLLVNDNYTREFLNSDAAERMKLAAASWGTFVPPSVVDTASAW